MDNNYFSDITELFIKAKKAENIHVSPHSKATIREMLAYKIDEMKIAEEAPQGSFFNKWKFQLMGVPASLFAVFLVVFAFQNLQVTMPGATEGSSLERNEVQTEATAEVSGTSEASEAIVKDIPVIEEADAEISDEAIVEDIPSIQKPELLTIDYSTPKTGGGDLSSTYNPTTETTQPDVAPYVVPVTLIAPTKQPTQETPTTTNDVVDTTYKPLPVPEVDVKKIEPEAINDMMDSEILLPNPDESINEFRDPFNPLVPEFDTEALNTIEKTDTLDNVNVHYLNKDQAAVEIIEPDSTRWYLFEAIDGKWTVTQKFD